jgi:HAD superfamily hydrolase (TIGR01509 family)
MMRNHATADPVPRAVVFDLDGLLIDTEWAFAEAARRMLASRGQTLEPEFFATMMGTPGRDALPRFRDRYRLPEAIEQLAAEYRTVFTDLFAGKYPPLMPGAQELIGRLERHGIPRAIATSSSRKYVDAVFGPHGLLDRFVFVLTCDDVTRGKPHPEVYTLAANRLGLPPAAVIVLEDSVNGLRAAKAAGCRCVVVPHEQTPREQLAPADLVVQRLDDAVLWDWMGIPVSRRSEGA